MSFSVGDRVKRIGYKTKQLSPFPHQCIGEIGEVIGIQAEHMIGSHHIPEMVMVKFLNMKNVKPGCGLGVEPIDLELV